MSALDHLPMPPVLQPLVASAAAAGKPLLIAHAKDLSEDDLALIRSFGRSLEWDDHLVNLPFSSHAVEYLIVDLRKKAARVELGKQDLSSFEVACYVPWIQKDEAFVKQLDANPITSFPKKCVSKADFDARLMGEKIASPSVWKSLFRLALGCLIKQ